MKKLVLVLAIALIAVPAFAAVTLTESGKTGTTVTVGYSRTTDVGLPRGFGLVLQATGGTITSVTATKIGESTAALPGYGIFPGTIDINEITGNPDSYGTPVEPNGLPGGPSALGTSRVVVALGSLYAGGNDSNKPGNTGTLFTVVCSAGTTGLCVSEEETYRGGVVDVNALGLTVAQLCVTFTCSPMPVVASAIAPTNGQTNVPVTTDLSWTAAGGTNAKYDVYFGLTSPGTLVSTNQTLTTYDTGTMLQGKTYYWKIVSKNDCNSTGVTSSTFSFTTTTCLPVGKVFNVACGTGPAVNLTVTAAMITKWDYLGQPKCWCCDAQKCGNGIYTGSSLNRPDAVDLTALQNSWMKQYNGAGYSPCMDTNLSGRVDAVDLTTLQNHWMKNVGSTGCL